MQPAPETVLTGDESWSAWRLDFNAQPVQVSLCSLLCSALLCSALLCSALFEVLTACVVHLLCCRTRTSLPLPVCTTTAQSRTDRATPWYLPTRPLSPPSLPHMLPACALSLCAVVQEEIIHLCRSSVASQRSAHITSPHRSLLWITKINDRLYC